MVGFALASKRRFLSLKLNNAAVNPTGNAHRLQKCSNIMDTTTHFQNTCPNLWMTALTLLTVTATATAPVAATMKLPLALT